MILDIDLGNTRMKWRTAQLKSARGIATADGCGVEELRLSLEGVTRIRVASVASPSVALPVIESLESVFALRPEICRVKEQLEQFHTIYREPGQLGIDRWLAALAAWDRLKTPCVVVDAGTALTVDLVNGEGCHLGGYIVPGFTLAVDSLAGGTGAVRVALADELPVLGPGLSTVEAVNHGLVELYLGLIERALTLLGGEAAVVVCGGDAPRLLGHLPKALSVPDLVLDGIALACP